MQGLHGRSSRGGMDVSYVDKSCRVVMDAVVEEFAKIGVCSIKKQKKILATHVNKQLSLTSKI
jgi:hypothetical protein